MSKEICLQLGKRLRYLRGKHHLTQDELAGRSGISTKYLQNLEGKTPKKATIVTLYKLAKAFKTTPSKLLDF